MNAKTTHATKPFAQPLTQHETPTFMSISHQLAVWRIISVRILRSQSRERDTIDDGCEGEYTPDDPTQPGLLTF